MNKSRRKFTAKFKTQVTLASIKEQKSIPELAQEFNLQPSQIKKWKKEFLDNAISVFESPANKKEELEELEKHNTKLYAKIGKLQVDVDFLKNALS
jgi:transposase